MQDTSVKDFRHWIDQVWQDVGSHSVFAETLLRVILYPSQRCFNADRLFRKRFTALASAFDVESLSHLCKVFYTHDVALDIMALHIKISDLIFLALLFLEQYDCETVGKSDNSVTFLLAWTDGPLRR